MVRLKDIAQRAGVSVMTVSKALRNASDIAAGTKLRIQALAREMGYVPNSLAQGLRTRSTRLVGLVIPAVTNPIFARLILAVEDQVRGMGYDLLLSHTLNEVDREEQVIRQLIARRVEGLLVFPVSRLGTRAPVYEELASRQIPTVILGPSAAFSRQFVSVQTDEVQASGDVTRHLLSLGHRRIAFLGGPPTSLWAQERYEGYQRALREHGMTVDDRLIFTAGSTIEEGEKAALQMLQEGADATAVQAVNDLIAIGAGDCLLSRGLRLPEELSLAGFGNVLTSAYFRVPLTTVRQPKQRMGIVAMHLLQELLRGRQPESQRLHAELLIRASTGPAPAASRLPSLPPNSKPSAPA